MLSANCSTSIINKSTRVTCTSATVLNHIITNKNRHFIRSVVIHQSIPNHFPIIAIIDRKFATKMLYKTLLVFSETLIQINIIMTCSYSSMSFGHDITL